VNRHWNSYLNRKLSRRDLLKVSSAGFGSLALAGLLGEEARAVLNVGRTILGRMKLQRLCTRAVPARKAEQKHKT